MTVYRAPQSILTEEGHFALRLVYRPQYAHDSLPGETHTLLYFSDSCEVYFDGDTSTVVLAIDGEELASDALTFDADQRLTLDVEHTDERRRVRVRGATAGNCRIDAEPAKPADIASQIYVLGPREGTIWTAVLVELRPINAVTFAELADARLLGQNDPDGWLRKVTRVLARRRGRIHDVALAMRDAYDIEHAEGEQLDTIGSIVGLPRHGFSDERHRVFLRIQSELLLAAGRDDAEWTGTAANILRIARTFVGPDAPQIRYQAYPPYSYTLRIVDLDYDEAFLLGRFLRTANWAGVLGYLLIELGEGNNLWASDSVSVDGGGIWGSASVEIAGAMKWGTVLTT